MRVIRRKDQILDAATDWLDDKAHRDPTESEKLLGAMDKNQVRGPVPDYRPEDVTEAILKAINWPLPVFACCICKGAPPALVEVVNDILCRQCAHRVFQEIARV